MSNSELIKQSINDYLKKLENGINKDLLKDINNFLEKYNNLNLLENDKELFLNFLNKIMIIIGDEKVSEPNIKAYIDYVNKKNSIIYELNNGDIDIQKINMLDEFFLDTKINFYVNLDEKSLRLIEEKLYKKLKEKNRANDYIKDLINNHKKIKFSLAIFLLMDLYKNNKHPAQIVSTLNKKTSVGYYNSVDGNININFNKFLSDFSLKNDRESINNYNIQLLLLIYHEAIHFLMLYNNHEYDLENNIMSIASNFESSHIHDEYYLEFCTNIGSIHYTSIFLQQLKLNDFDYYNYLLEGIKRDYYNKYYEVLEKVRLGDPHERIYRLVNEAIDKDELNDENFKNCYRLELRNNKIIQEREGKVFDDYELTTFEVKRILLVIMLEYARGNTYSSFNRDIVKDLVIMDTDSVISKYKSKEKKKSLQDLYLLINKNLRYTDDCIKESIMNLQVGYPYLNIVEYLWGKEKLVHSRN